MREISRIGDARRAVLEPSRALVNHRNQIDQLVHRRIERETEFRIATFPVRSGPSFDIA